MTGAASNTASVAEIRAALACGKAGCECSRPSGNTHCAAHDDRSPSLGLTEREGRVLVHCHAGCGQAAVVAALREQGLWPEVETPAGGPERPRVVARYSYVDELGEVLFEVERLSPKGFRQRRPDGRGGWAWSLGDVRRVLYRLPRVIEAVGGGETIFVVEGEKDAETLEAFGVVATTSPGGAGKWRTEYSETLRGAHVVIVADRDEPGRRHAQQVADALRGVAAEVRLVEAREGKDSSDHLAAGYGLGDFVEVASIARSNDLTIKPAEHSGFDRLDRLIAHPPYPVEALPDEARRYVEELAATGLPVEMVAPALIACAGVAAGNRATIEIKTGTWSERAAIWIAIVAPTGSTKSPALSGAVRLLEQAAPEAITTDSTPEAIGVLARDHPGVLLDRDELSGWARGLDQYRRGGERALMLSAWDGRPFRVARKDPKKSVLAERPVISIAGGLQPGGLGDLARADGAEDGLIPRFLWINSPVAKAPRWSDSTVSPAGRAQIEGRFAALAAMPEEVVYRLSPEAAGRWEIMFNSNAAELDAASGDAQRALLAKVPRHVARVALVLHVLRDETPRAISNSTLNDAITIVRWHLDQASSLFAEETIGGLGGRLLRIIRDAGQPIGTTEINRWLGGHTPARDRDAALADLEARGLIASTVVTPGEKGGRRATLWSAVRQPSRLPTCRVCQSAPADAGDREGWPTCTACAGAWDRGEVFPHELWPDAEEVIP